MMCSDLKLGDLVRLCGFEKMAAKSKLEHDAYDFHMEDYHLGMVLDMKAAWVKLVCPAGIGWIAQDVLQKLQA